jgi:hypothetical protein
MTNNHYAKVLGLKMACKKIVMKKKIYHKKKNVYFKRGIPCREGQNEYLKCYKLDEHALKIIDETWSM